MDNKAKKESKPMDLESIRKQNPWKKVDIYKGQTDILYNKDECFALPEDINILDKYNQDINDDLNKLANSADDKDCKKREKLKKQKFNLNIPVYPWYGNPLTAKVIVLSLNPACNDHQDKTSQIIQKLQIPAKNEFVNHLRNMLTFDVEGFLPSNDHNGAEVTARDLANLHQNWYWESRLKKAFPDIDFEEINKKFAVIEYIPYSSELKPLTIDGLESQKFTKELIRQICRYRPETLFIVSRCRDKWKSLLKDIWNGEPNKNFIVPDFNRAQSMSENVLKEDYKRVRKAFALNE